jgi:hypothetical protein
MPLLGRGLQTAAQFKEKGPALHEMAKGTGTGETGHETRSGEQARRRPGLFETCANPDCNSGWLHLRRSRNSPLFEGGWTCSVECTRARVQFAVTRELSGHGRARVVHRHRIPLGLLMMERGWISQDQLRRALDAQKAAGTGRLGQWLIRQGAVSEAVVTRALGLQWSCPVLPLEPQDAASMTAVMPRLFVDAYGTLPLRVSAGRILYLGFEGSLDPVLALAVSRMTGLHVESGIVQEAYFRSAHARMLEAKFPSVELVEAVSQPAAAYALASAVERARPIASRLVRLHDCLWLRMWSKTCIGPLPENGSVQDVVCSVGMI